jgi:hypothetical protein
LAVPTWAEALTREDLIFSDNAHAIDPVVKAFIEELLRNANRHKKLSKPPSKKEILHALQWYTNKGSGTAGKLRKCLNSNSEPQEWKKVNASGAGQPHFI